MRCGARRYRAGLEPGWSRAGARMEPGCSQDGAGLQQHGARMEPERSQATQDESGPAADLISLCNTSFGVPTHSGGPAHGACKEITQRAPYCSKGAEAVRIYSVSPTPSLTHFAPPSHPSCIPLHSDLRVTATSADLLGALQLARALLSLFKLTLRVAILFSKLYTVKTVMLNLLIFGRSN